MERAEYRKHFELEEGHWWFRGRRKILRSLVRRLPKSERPRIWLDAGCGTGFNMTAFARFGRVFGCDYSEDALDYCRKRGLADVVRADVQKLPYKERAFDVVSLLDVLYHQQITDDVAVLKEAYRLLRLGGCVLISDSAFPFLKSAHDLAVHARERYRRKTLKKRLEAAGFEIVRMSYFNFFLFPIVALVRIAERRLAKKIASGGQIQSDLKRVPRFLNGVLAAILALESGLIRRVSLPWGSSIVCLARKRTAA